MPTKKKLAQKRRGAGRKAAHMHLSQGAMKLNNAIIHAIINAILYDDCERHEVATILERVLKGARVAQKESDR